MPIIEKNIWVETCVDILGEDTRINNIITSTLSHGHNQCCNSSTHINTHKRTQRGTIEKSKQMCHKYEYWNTYTRTSKKTHQIVAWPIRKTVGMFSRQLLQWPTCSLHDPILRLPHSLLINTYLRCHREKPKQKPWSFWMQAPPVTLFLHQWALPCQSLCQLGDQVCCFIHFLSVCVCVYVCVGYSLFVLVLHVC